VSELRTQLRPWIQASNFSLIEGNPPWIILFGLAGDKSSPSKALMKAPSLADNTTRRRPDENFTTRPYDVASICRTPEDMAALFAEDLARRLIGDAVFHCRRLCAATYARARG